MENKTKTKTFGILSMNEMQAVKAGNGTVIEVPEPEMVKDSSIT
jgi:hypothetical protein